MGRKKLDVKVCSLIKDCVITRQRSIFLIIGSRSRDQVVTLHHILQKSRNHEKYDKLSVLWCYKKDHGFSFICHKTQRMLKKKYSGNHSLSDEDCFDHFIASADVKFCHYGDATSVLGQTFGMLVIQDFEAVTPNILARIVECVEGGGIIIIILPNIQSLQEIPSLKMDAHARYVTSSHSEVNPLFNQRFVLSLSDCKNCMVLDDSLRILLLPTTFGSSSTEIMIKKTPCKSQSDPIDVLSKISALCCTKDQADALQLLNIQLKERFANCVVSLTSARGRGKSATLGLAVASALYLKYSNIYVTSPHIDNLQTLFHFIIKGMEVFDSKGGKDYNLAFTSVENENLISGIQVFQHQKQVVKYLHPTEFCKVEIADLVIIDEAAAIPLPIVKSWINASIVFMASTINGYEGTGRSLSLKLMNQLRKQSLPAAATEEIFSQLNKKDFTLHEITLNEAIRYADGDSVETWLNSLFCLDTEMPGFGENFPNPESCQLYYVNRNVLFSYNPIAEKFLQQLVALFVSSHYKNCPNDLLMMADAPSHHLFCLLPPVDKNSQCLPSPLCVIQVALEGKISKDSIIQELSHGKRASGDLIPWIISQQFQDNDFPLLSGARIVRIATHSNYQRMGYGQHALQLLFSYYKESAQADAQPIPVELYKSTLLLRLNELEPERLHYIGVSYGLTLELLRFWKKLEFVPLYLRQTASEVTGEYSCVMIKSLQTESLIWLSEFSSDFLQRFVALLTSAFRNLPASTVLEILHYKKTSSLQMKDYFTSTNEQILTRCSFKRLQSYCNHLVDYHLIMDLLPLLSRLYFLNYFKCFFLSSIQESILLCIGLQNKAVEEISLELNMETNSVMGLFAKAVKRILQHLPEPEQDCLQKSILLCIGLQNKAVEEISLELNMETNSVMGLFAKAVKRILQHLPEPEQDCLQKDSSGQKILKSKAFSCEAISSKRKQENFHPKKWKKKKL